MCRYKRALMLLNVDLDRESYWNMHQCERGAAAACEGDGSTSTVSAGQARGSDRNNVMHPLLNCWRVSPTRISGLGYRCCRPPVISLSLSLSLSLSRSPCLYSIESSPHALYRQDGHAVLEMGRIIFYHPYPICVMYIDHS